MNDRQFFSNAARIALISSFSILLTACGGGDSGSSDSSQSDSSQLSATSASSARSRNSGHGRNSGTSTGSGTTTGSGTGTGTGTSTGSGTSTTVAGPAGQDASLYTLTFSDDFNSFNSSVWNDHIWYEASNATKNYTVENGVLKIWPQRDATGNFFNRTIDTDGKFYQTYGYFEMEAKLPIGKGTWPAFWLYNHDQSNHPEIDIMEAYAGGVSPWGDSNRHPTAYGTTAWPTGGNGSSYFKQNMTPDLSAGFHKYGVKWEPSKLTFYFDGSAVYTVNVTMSSRMYILLDLWYGSASGTPDSTTPTGSTNSYQVNYVRAWQFK